MSQRGLFYGWVVLVAAATVVAIGQGSLFALGVFLKPLEDSMRWNRSAISMTALINWMAMGVGSFFWGAISDRLGSRLVTMAGGFLLGLSLVLSSQATALWHLHITFGLGVGFAAGAFLTPLSATATKWFTTNRGLAVGIVSAGGGAGMLLLSPLTRWVTSAYDWRVATSNGQVVAGMRGKDGKLADARKVLRAGAPVSARPGENTTIGVVATNARLTKTQVSRVALMTDDGLARAIYPSHTQGDGDTVFALATGSWNGNADLTTVGALAADVMSEAIVRAAAMAKAAGGLPAAADTGTVPARLR